MTNELEGLLVSAIMVGVVIFSLWSVGELGLIVDGIRLFFELFF